MPDKIFWQEYFSDDYFCAERAARANSSSMTREKALTGWAPDRCRPLMKNAGVPVTPARAPSSMSFWIAFWYLPLLRHSSKISTKMAPDPHF